MFLKNATQPSEVIDAPDVDINDILLNVHTTKIRINTYDHKSGGTYIIDVTALGMIQSRAE